MSENHKLNGELALLRKKIGKLTNENRALSQKIKTYKESEIQRSNKETKKQEIFKKLQNIDKKNCESKTDVIFVDKILAKDLNFDIFEQYVKNDYIFDKYAPFFLRTHPLQIYSFLKLRNLSNIKNPILLIFIQKHIKPELESEWDHWYIE